MQICSAKGDTHSVLFREPFARLFAYDKKPLYDLAAFSLKFLRFLKLNSERDNEYSPFHKITRPVWESGVEKNCQCRR